MRNGKKVWRLIQWRLLHRAFYPLEEEQIELVLEYRVAHKECKTFTDGLYQEYQELSRRLVKRGEKTVRLPFSREEGIQLRRKCVGRTYREFGPDGAGFSSISTLNMGMSRNLPGSGRLSHDST